VTGLWWLNCSHPCPN